MSVFGRTQGIILYPIIVAADVLLLLCGRLQSVLCSVFTQLSNS